MTVDRRRRRGFEGPPAVFLDDPRLHVFELQLVHQKLSLMRTQIGGHADYKVTRAAAEISLKTLAVSPKSPICRFPESLDETPADSPTKRVLKILDDAPRSRGVTTEL